MALCFALEATIAVSSSSSITSVIVAQLYSAQNDDWLSSAMQAASSLATLPQPPGPIV
jgi:hypothetical protein